MTLTNLPQWTDLQNHFSKVQNLHLREIFLNDPNRGVKLGLQAGDIYLDYSKNRVTEETLNKLFELARARGVESARDDMFSGKKINTTENRAVLHTALRNTADNPIYVDQADVMPDVRSELTKMRQFSAAVRNGNWLGYSGKRIRNVINI